MNVATRLSSYLNWASMCWLGRRREASRLRSSRPKHLPWWICCQIYLCPHRGHDQYMHTVVPISVGRSGPTW